MKSLTASDRKSLIRLASSLPKGDKSRRAILAGLNKVKVAAIDTLVLQDLSSDTVRELSDAYKRAQRYISEMYFWSENEVEIGDDFYREVTDGLPGFAILGSLLPNLGSSSKKEVEDAIGKARSRIMDTRKAISSFDDDANDAGGWRWEDEEATWGDSFRMVDGKVVNGKAISDMLLEKY